MIDSNILNYSCLEPLNVSRETFPDLEEFRQIIIQKNRSINLISKQSEQVSKERHIIDSAQIIDFIDLNLPICTDIGSGSGLPGIVLAIHLPATQITLAEKNQKKAYFLEKTIKKLNISNASVFNKSINEQTQLQSFSHITARALSEIEKIINISSHLLEKDGEYLLFKGKKEIVEKEIARIKKYKTEVFKSDQTDKQRHLVRITINTQ